MSEQLLACEMEAVVLQTYAVDLPHSDSEGGKSKRTFAKLCSLAVARNCLTPALETSHLSAKQPSQSILSKLIRVMMLPFL